MLIRRAATVAATLAATLAASVLVAACSVVGGSGSGPTAEGGITTGSDGGTTTGSPSSGPEPYLPVPDGVVLTEPGTELGLGESATVAWRLRAKGIGVLTVKVRKLVKADIRDLKEWQLDRAGRRSALYYVTVTVANAGRRDLSGLRIPLYVLSGAGALVESSEFKSKFDRCPSRDLPAGFTTGEKVTACQAYLVPEHGKLEAIAFRANPKFDPVTWVGKVASPKPPKKPDKQG